MAVKPINALVGAGLSPFESRSLLLSLLQAIREAPKKPAMAAPTPPFKRVRRSMRAAKTDEKVRLSEKLATGSSPELSMINCLRSVMSSSRYQGDYERLLRLTKKKF